MTWFGKKSDEAAGGGSPVNLEMPLATSLKSKGRFDDTAKVAAVFIEATEAIHNHLSHLDQEIAGLRQQVAALQGRSGGAAGDGDPASSSSPPWGEIADFLYKRLQYPFLRDLLLYYDRVAATALDLERGTVPPSIEDLALTVGSFRDEVQELLADNGFTTISTDGPIDPELHLVKAFRATADRSLQNRISRTVRQGFQRHSQVIRKAEVEAYRFDESEAPV